MPEELIATEKILAGLAKSPDRLAEATRLLTEAQLRAAPARDEWSAGEVLAHLRACADVWGKCMADALAHDRPKWRAVSPRTYIDQTDYVEQDFAPALKAFTAQRKQLIRLLSPLTPRQWKREAIVSGVGRVLHPTVHAYAHRLWTHERGHVKQIERIAEAARGGEPYLSSRRPAQAEGAGFQPAPTYRGHESAARANRLEFSGRIWVWKGPAPWYFVTVPAKQSRDLIAIVRMVTYGWGMIPVSVRIGKTEWKTALWPKDGKYIVPIKAHVRKAEKLEQGDTVTIRLEVV